MHREIAHKAAFIMYGRGRKKIRKKIFELATATILKPGQPGESLKIKSQLYQKKAFGVE
jgi:hypothetical protein